MDVLQVKAEEIIEEINTFNWKQFLKYFGPGLLVSIAYLDPGNCYFLRKKLIFFSGWRY